MIPIQIGLTILLVLILAAIVVEVRDLRRDRQADRFDELTELEVRQHVHPDGNVHVLTPHKETDQSD